VVVLWVRTLTPRDFGYCRSRWCCLTLAVVLWDVHRVTLKQKYPTQPNYWGAFICQSDSRIEW
jgi:hypothetical protein